MKSLTAKESYIAMIQFLEKFYFETQSDDVGSLLGSMQFLEDQSSADPGMWSSWLKILEERNNDKTVDKV